MSSTARYVFQKEGTSGLDIPHPFEHLELGGIIVALKTDIMPIVTSSFLFLLGPSSNARSAPIVTSLLRS